MPLYEYICRECENHFEKRVSFSEADNEQDCPACGSKHSQKQISLFASTGTAKSSGSSFPTSSCGGAGGFT
jgi:putative FmdB family regulatory protein